VALGHKPKTLNIRGEGASRLSSAGLAKVLGGFGKRSAHNISALAAIDFEGDVDEDGANAAPLVKFPDPPSEVDRKSPTVIRFEGEASPLHEQRTVLQSTTPVPPPGTRMAVGGSDYAVTLSNQRILI
jgi:hypothetical protein